MPDEDFRLQRLQISSEPPERYEKFRLLAEVHALVVYRRPRRETGTPSDNLPEREGCVRKPRDDRHTDPLSNVGLAQDTFFCASCGTGC
jgi:hypothetical protein